MSLRSFLARRRPQRPQSAFVVVLLLLTLVLAGLLAQQANTAARSHRAVAERTLRDYAAFAAWKLSGTIKNELYWIFGMALWPLTDSPEAAQGRLPDPSAFTIPPEKVEYIPFHLVRAYFRVSLRDGAIEVRGQETSPATREWIADTVCAHARRLYGADWKMAAITGTVAGEPHTLVYVLTKEIDGAPTVANGFELDRGAFLPVLDRLYREGHYLPPSLIGDLPTDSLMSLVVREPGGAELYRSARQYPATFAASDSVGTPLGRLTASLALRPEVAERLVIGGLPHSRLPLLLGLLALTTGLVGAALFQHRREYELTAMRSEFVSNVSHELRTPLAQIRMFAETLLLGRVRSEDEARRSLEIIDQEARRLTHLVENVLHFSRSERRALRVAPEPTDVSGLVAKVVDAFLPLARARQVSVRTELEAGLVAPVDPSAVCQVVLNLLDNAVKYGPSGQRLTVGTSSAPDRLWIRVDDEGPGVPAKDRERIWERFSRLDRDGATAVAGTGIGLSVARDLVRLHGGRAWVDEAPGGGARFLVELPRTPAGAGAGPGGAANGGGAGGAGDGSSGDGTSPATDSARQPEGAPR